MSRLEEMLAKQLRNALHYIMIEDEDKFVDDMGKPCEPHKGGVLSCSGEHFNYGEYEFDFREAEAALNAAGKSLMKWHKTKRSNFNFLQQFATKEGAEAAMARAGFTKRDGSAWWEKKCGEKAQRKENGNEAEEEKGQEA